MSRLNSDLITSTEVKKSKRVFKVIVLGDSNVGKTCLTYRFCEGRFPSRTEATIGVDFRERSLFIKDEEIKLQLWDTAGQERFRHSMLPHYYRNVHAVVFVYDVTKPSSFMSLPNWLQECDEHYLTADIPRLLVGNKCDEAALVGTQAAQRFADSHSMPLFETSAKDESKADHVESIFMTLALKLASSKPLMARTLSNASSLSASAAASTAAAAAGGDAMASNSFSLASHSYNAHIADYDNDDPCLC